MYYTMKTLPELQKQQQLLLAQIQEINELKRGKISIQTPTRRRADGSEYKAGPFYVFQVWQDGKNNATNIPAEQYPVLRPLVENYERFKDLCDQLADTLEQIASHQNPELAAKKKPSNRRASKKSRSSSNKSTTR